MQSIHEHAEVRVDLHVHSEHSDAPYSYFLRSAKSAECYTAVRHVYETARLRGMDLVTISDHDNIDAAVELAALGPDTFVSEEVSARFPEDGNIMHVIVLDISEAQHGELQRLRGNIYELAAYLEAERLPHFLCHPLSAVNRRLVTSHLERCLLMFRNLELRNGTRDQAHEDALRRIVAGTDREALARLAEKHPGTPWINREARWGFTGGSDDHGRVGIARAFTTYQGPATTAGLRAALAEQRTDVGGENGTARTLGHNAYGVLVGYMQRDGAATLASAASGTSRLTSTFGKHLASNEDGRRFTWDECWKSGHEAGYEDWLHGRLSGLLVDLHRSALGSLAGALGKADLMKASNEVPELLRGLFLDLPYILAARYASRDRLEAARQASELGFPERTARGPRVAVFTDSIDDVNGVALGLRRVASEARSQGHDLRLVGIAEDAGQTRVSVDAEGVVRLPTVYRHRLSMYASMEFGIPHLPAVLDWLVAEGITLVQCSTPGPVGLAGLAAARLAGLPVVGQYHTEVPEYATRLSGDPTVGALVGAVTGWFYRQMDRVLVPSDAVARRVVELGVLAGKVERVPRGVDLELFHAGHRDSHAYEEFGLNGDPKVLYVGRLSREKGLDSLVEGFHDLTPAEAKLILVGQGPHREQLVEKSAGGRVIFAGERHGKPLARLYASADVFVFPSETETFGNAVVEAQAAGLPVVVSGRGAAAENVVDGVTGLVVDATRPGELNSALALLLGDRALRERMGRAASLWARRYSLPEAVRGTFATYASCVE